MTCSCSAPAGACLLHPSATAAAPEPVKPCTCAEGFKKEFHKDLKPETLPEVPCVPFQFLLDK